MGGLVELIRGRVKTPIEVFMLHSVDSVHLNSEFKDWTLHSFMFKQGAKTLQYDRELAEMSEGKAEIWAIPVYPELREVLDYDYVVTDGARVAPAMFEWIIVEGTEEILLEDPRINLALKLLSNFKFHLKMVGGEPDV